MFECELNWALKRLVGWILVGSEFLIVLTLFSFFPVGAPDKKDFFSAAQIGLLRAKS